MTDKNQEVDHHVPTSRPTPIPETYPETKRELALVVGRRRPMIRDVPSDDVKAKRRLDRILKAYLASSCIGSLLCVLGVLGCGPNYPAQTLVDGTPAVYPDDAGKCPDAAGGVGTCDVKSAEGTIVRVCITHDQVWGNPTGNWCVDAD
jgi:hypothetical protein